MFGNESQEEAKGVRSIWRLGREIVLIGDVCCKCNTRCFFVCLFVLCIFLYYYFVVVVLRGFVFVLCCCFCVYFLCQLSEILPGVYKFKQVVHA